MGASLLAYLKANWKTNLAAACAFAYSVPQVVTAIGQWQAGQKPDWHQAVISLVVAAGLAVAKDGDNHSTVAQVQQATADKAAPGAPVPLVPKKQ
jgi:drug/metabolite transporter (DMT)-like permease